MYKFERQKHLVANNNAFCYCLDILFYATSLLLKKNNYQQQLINDSRLYFGKKLSLLKILFKHTVGI